MKERPILMSGPLVVRTLDEVNPKTHTRRVLRPQPPPECTIHYMLGNESWKDDPTPLRHTWEAWSGDLFRDRPARHLCGTFTAKCPYGAPGDRLWVREAWRLAEMDGTDDGEVCDGKIAYRADGALLGMQLDYSWALDHVDVSHPEPKWRPSIHMPRWASRITLEVVDVRVERVQDISDADAKAEGTERRGMPGRYGVGGHLGAFIDLWDSLNEKRGFGWDVNPWVWAVTFRRVEP